MEYHTLKGYEILESKEMTYAMEDYLEMICRFYYGQKIIRVSELSKSLNVKPSSVTKMVNNLKNIGLVTFQKYGYIKPTDAGLKLGDYLIQRHAILYEFLCMINNTDDELEEVEKIEHFLNSDTVKNIEKLNEKLKNKKL